MYVYVHVFLYVYVFVYVYVYRESWLCDGVGVGFGSASQRGMSSEWHTWSARKSEVNLQTNSSLKHVF